MVKGILFRILLAFSAVKDHDGCFVIEESRSSLYAFPSPLPTSMPKEKDRLIPARAERFASW